MAYLITSYKLLIITLETEFFSNKFKFTLLQ